MSLRRTPSLLFLLFLLIFPVVFAHAQASLDLETGVVFTVIMMSAFPVMKEHFFQ